MIQAINEKQITVPEIEQDKKKLRIPTPNTENSFDSLCPSCGNAPAVNCGSPCETCADQLRRAYPWHNRRGHELINLADGVGVGRRFCHGGSLPSFEDAGLVERIRQRPLPSGGLLVVGPNGSHKTHLLAARTIDAARRGWSAYLLSWTQFVLEVRATYRDGAKLTELDVIHKYGKKDYLALDDLGVGRLVDGRETEHCRQLCYQLLNTRYERGLITDISTNCMPDELKERFDLCIARRIEEMCKPYPMLLDVVATQKVGPAQ